MCICVGVYVCLPLDVRQDARGLPHDARQDARGLPHVAEASQQQRDHQ